MPVRPREMNDQPTEARIRQIIRHILDQEVRRLNTTSSGLAALIAANTASILVNVADIDNVERRGAARNNEGIFDTDAAGSGGVEVTESAFGSTQEWTVQIPSQPITVTLWEQASFTNDALFDGFQFDAAQFNEGTLIQQVNTTILSTFTPATNVFSIDWGVAKSGTLYLHDFGDGTAYGVVAVAD